MRARLGYGVPRYGGDEFVVLLSDVACSEDAAFSADQLLAAIAMPHLVGDQDLHVTASVGVSVYPGDGTDAVTLLRKADLALLRARPDRSVWPRKRRVAELSLVTVRHRTDPACPGHLQSGLPTSSGDAA